MNPLFLTARIAVLLIVAMVAARATLAQEGAGQDDDHEPLPGLDDEAPNPVEFEIKVPVRLSGLVDDVERVVVHCVVYSRFQTGALGGGKTVLSRGGRPGFDGSAFQGVVTVPIREASDLGPNDVPIDAWMEGMCLLTIETGRSREDQRTFVERALGTPLLPLDCTARRSPSIGPQHLARCVWPGTRPSDAMVEFHRPGFEPPGDGE